MSNVVWRDREARLLLLPLFEKAPLPGSKRAKPATPTWKSGVHEGFGEALIDLLELTLLVSSFLAGGRASAIHKAEDWLSDIRACIKEMISLAQEGPWDVFVSERDELSLADVLGCRPDLGRSKLRYPGKMLEFWLAEIGRRGEEIVSLCVQEVAVGDIVKTHAALRRLPYPPI